MSTFTFQKAERRQRKARIAVFGPSGSGKTYTSLAIGSGLGERIALIDTERHSASLYAGRFDFDAGNLDNHRVESYLAAINAAAQAGYDVLIIDSLTHAWQELLEEVDRVKARSRSGNSFNAWGEVTPKHKRLVSAILNYPGHVIATMRAKTAYVVEKDERGKSVPKKVGQEPEQRGGLEYEFDMCIEMNADHVGFFDKDRTEKFQDRHVEKPGKELGQEIRDWLASGAPEPARNGSTGTDWSDDGVFRAACFAAMKGGDTPENREALAAMVAAKGYENSSQMKDARERAAFVAELKGGQ